MKTTKFSTLEVSNPYQHVLLITLNRPEYSNAFNTVMAQEIIDLFESLSLQTLGNRTVVLTGKGEKAFCAGGDLKERRGMSDQEWSAQHLIFERMIRSILDCPIPSIGAINGVAFGGGCELAAALDFIYCSDNAKFAQTETKIGIIPGAGGTQTLSRAVGERRAKEIIFSGLPFGARDAEKWGLVNSVFASGKLLEEVLSIAKIISKNAPVAVKQAKQAIHRGLQLSIRDGLAFEIEAYNRTIPTRDRREGVNAFNEKRIPIFKGN